MVRSLPKIDDHSDQTGVNTVGYIKSFPSVTCNSTKLTVHCFSGSVTVYEVDVEGEFVISVEEYASKKPLVFFW